MNLHTITATIHLPDGYQPPGNGSTYVTLTTPRTSAGIGSNQAPKTPWIVTFTVDSDVAGPEEAFTVSARIDGYAPTSLSAEHTFTWNGGDQEVDVQLSAQ
ncbi:hypothetical protein ACIPQ1_09820 [Pseudomonas sp. LARHCG127]